MQGGAICYADTVDNLWQVILLGVIEGITEFLPISSTGHLLVAEHWLGARSEMFNIVIQAGAVSAVVLIYWRRLAELALQWNERANRDYLLKLAAAFGITAGLGLLVKHYELKLPETVQPVAWALVVGGLFIIAAEWAAKRRLLADDITWKVAVLVGVAQVAAGIFPGTSRSAATIMGCLLIGLSRPAATEFSFLVGIPTMFAASAFAVHHEWKAGPVLSSEWTDLAVGFAVSAVVAFGAVKWLIHYVQRNTFIPFAVYRLVLGIGLLIAFR